MPDGTAPAVASEEDPHQLSELLAAAHAGRLPPDQADALFAALYDELHRIARRELFRGVGPVTLSPTTLLHEAYLALRSASASFPDRDRFFAYAARAMRGLIVDHARRRRAARHGGQFHFTSFDAGDVQLPAADEPLAALSDALDELAQAEPALAELVELKYFCGFDLAEIAAMRGVTERTVQRHWDKARVFLKHSLAPGLTAVDRSPSS